MGHYSQESPFDLSLELLKRAQHDLQGPEFEQLFEYYYPYIVQYFLNRELSLEDAEELAQSVFLRISQALPRYQHSEKKFSGWVFTIVRRLLYNFYRGVKNAPPQSAFLNLQDPEAEFVADMSTGNPEEQYELKEIRGAIEEALLQIGETNRQIFLLHYQEGKSHAQIQECLDLGTPTASRSRKVRTLKALKEYLERQGLR